jgi:hypothetical protein
MKAYILTSDHATTKMDRVHCYCRKFMPIRQIMVKDDHVKHTTVATNMNAKFTEVTDGMVVSDEKTGESHFM